MAVDTRLPLAANQPIDTATPIQQMGQQQNQNAMAAEQTLKAHYENLTDRDKTRLTSTVAAASQLKPYLDNNDLEGAHSFLEQRKAMLQQRMGSGENVDTQETDHALELLRTGQVDQLKEGVTGLMAAGQVYGILNNQNMPSNVQEWQYYNRLSPDDKQNYLTMKRANQVIDLGGQKIIPSQTNPAAAPQASFPVGLKPEDQPANAQAKAESSKMGEDIAAQKKAVAAAQPAAQQVLSTLDTMEQINHDVPYGNFGLEKAQEIGSNMAGTGKAADAGAQWDQLNSKNFVNGISQLAASGSVGRMDIPIVNAVIAANGIPKTLNPEGRAKLIGQLRDIVQRSTQATSDTLSNLQGSAAPGGGQGQGQKITVTNGKETYQIDQSDLPAAQAEGFKQQ